MTRKKRRALLCMLAVPLLALAPRSEESLPASAAEPAAVPEKYVALTFDDGPWPETTEQLLDGLAERGAKATFFLIGEQIAGHEDTVRRMADEGHQVGSHTFTHMDLSRGDPAERLREIAEARLNHPDVPLKELAAMMDPPVSKSGANHRLTRIAELADRLREEASSDGQK